jgi:hypothetical protein
VNWFKISFKEMPLLVVITALNAATFWPLAFDLIDFLAGLLGLNPKYASFDAMPVIFYGAWLIFAALIGVIALKLCLSIASILAVYTINGNSDTSKPNTVTDDFNKETQKHFSTMGSILIVFLISFGVGLYQQGIRFDQIQLINKVENQEKDIQILEAKLNNFSMDK